MGVIYGFIEKKLEEKAWRISKEIGVRVYSDDICLYDMQFCSQSLVLRVYHADGFWYEAGAMVNVS